MSTNQTSATNGFIATDSVLVRTNMHTRRLHSHAPHLVPLLDALPARAVVCDIGCGPGSITLDIAQRYPHISVLGIDIEPKSIAMAKADAEASKTSNLKYSIGDATTLTSLTNTTPGFEAVNGGCDIVYSHMVLMHVTEPLAAMKQMRAASKPDGGKIASKETDSGTWFFYPENPGTKVYLQMMPQFLSARKGDPFFGRKLITHALAAGYRRDQVSASVGDWTIATPEARREWAELIEMFSGEMSATTKQAVSADLDVDSIVDGFKAWAACEDGFGALPSPVIICER